MKRLIAAAFFALALLALVGTMPVQAGDTLVFQATVNQSSLVSSHCMDGVCHLVFKGSGAANIARNVTWTFTFVQDNTTTPSSEFYGAMTMEGATGTITLSDFGLVCPGSGPFRFPLTISSSWEITGGTGEFEGITGSGTSRGVIAGQGPVGHYQGTASY